jgi:hypothetical protein
VPEGDEAHLEPHLHRQGTLQMEAYIIDENVPSFQSADIVENSKMKTEKTQTNGICIYTTGESDGQTVRPLLQMKSPTQCSQPRSP